MTPACLPEVSTHLSGLRARAREQFAREGLPGPQSERWRFTPLPDSLADDAAPPPPGVGHDLAPALAALLSPDWPVVSVVNGVPLPNGQLAGGLLSTLAREDGVPPASLGTVLTLADHPLAALNTLRFPDALVVRVPAGTACSQPLVVVWHGTPGMSAPRLCLELARGSSLNLIELHTAAAGAVVNAVSEITIADGARLGHLRLQDQDFGSHLYALAAVRLGRDADCQSLVCQTGGSVSRCEVSLSLDGPGASTTLNGLSLAGRGQTHDLSTIIEHRAAHCRSNQTCKVVLADDARSVFQGKIHVHSAGQQTDGYQMNRALLLSDDAVHTSKPELEIYADDVRCSHGATVSALDAEQIGYLRARGIPAARARRLLVESFIAELLGDELPGPASTDHVTAGLRRHFAGRLAAPTPE